LSSAETLVAAPISVAAASARIESALFEHLFIGTYLHGSGKNGSVQKTSTGTDVPVQAQRKQEIPVDGFDLGGSNKLYSRPR
jgi:hypothetical protein